MKGLLNWFTSNTEEETFRLPSTEEMITKCLIFYLEPFKCFLLSKEEYPQDVSILKVVEQVKDIYEQHKSLFVQIYQLPQPVTVDIKLVSRSVPLLFTGSAVCF